MDALQRRLAITPFSRMVFSFKYDDDETLIAINDAITKVATLTQTLALALALTLTLTLTDAITKVATVTLALSLKNSNPNPNPNRNPNPFIASPSQRSTSARCPISRAQSAATGAFG